MACVAYLYRRSKKLIYTFLNKNNILRLVFYANNSKQKIFRIITMVVYNIQIRPTCCHKAKNPICPKKNLIL